jgi:hypothetical protein
MAHPDESRTGAEVEDDEDEDDKTNPGTDLQEAMESLRRVQSAAIRHVSDISQLRRRRSSRPPPPR